MNQMYLNGPSTGRAMSAEEFLTGAGLRFGPPSPAGCGCGGDTCPDESCGQGDCYQPMICCCLPASPAPQPPQVDEGCCCK